jgi:glycosyltransferase involved in cell wall biosynthesis
MALLWLYAGILEMHIAFANLASSGWTAGGHYLKNLFIALKQLDKPSQPVITLLATKGTPPDQYRFLDPYIDNLVFIRETKWQRYWKSAYLRIPIPEWLERLVVPRKGLITQLRKNQVDILYSNTEYGPHFPIPLLSWIPDFQHAFLPELFSTSKIRTRDRHNDRIARYATRVILSSQSALSDLGQAIPQAVQKACVVSFVAQIPPGVYDIEPMKVCERYHLPEKFFYLPNQFWKHKNHAVVLEALTLLKKEHPEFIVVCTGNSFEFRGQGYYQQLVETIHVRGLDEAMVLLGLVPHENIFQLMRQSLAVLQPSLFEGWSTTVEEAKSLGKGMIVSNIPVHKEQNPPESVFFDPHDPQMLADCLVEIYDKRQPGPDAKLEANAQNLLPIRTRQFAENFIQVTKEAVANNSLESGRNISEDTR